METITREEFAEELEDVYFGACEHEVEGGIAGGCEPCMRDESLMRSLEDRGPLGFDELARAMKISFRDERALIDQVKRLKREGWIEWTRDGKLAVLGDGPCEFACWVARDWAEVAGLLATGKLAENVFWSAYSQSARLKQTEWADEAARRFADQMSEAYYALALEAAGLARSARQAA